MLWIFFLIFIILVAGGYHFAVQLLNLMIGYLTSKFNIAVVALSPADTIVTILNVDLLLAAAILLPFIFFWIINYITPALYENERKILFAYLPVVLLLGMLGLACGWLMSTRIFIPFLQ